MRGAEQTLCVLSRFIELRGFVQTVCALESEGVERFCANFVCFLDDFFSSTLCLLIVVS